MACRPELVISRSVRGWDWDGLRSACWRAEKVERSRRGASSGTKPERNAAAEPQTEAAASAVNETSRARDERGRSVAEWAWSEGGRGSDQ
jgi:hypothetical protein